MNKLPKIAIPVIIVVIILIIVISKTAVNINSGERGVMFERFGGGVVTDEPALEEGFHIILPWNNAFIYEVRQQTLDEKLKVLSSNGLDIRLDASVWFAPEPKTLGKLHQDKGQAYIDRLIRPSIRSASRAVIGRYTPEQLYASERESIQNEILQEANELLDDQFIDVRRILVRDVTLPQTIKSAIERKLSQEQQSLEYEFRLTKAEKEAKRQKIEAEGKARANRILSASLTDKILQEKGIEATKKLAESDNAKTIIMGGGEGGLPVILGK